jgi:hypothetical protein
MYRILIFCVVSFLGFLSCRPTVKEEVQTVEPPAVTLRDTSHNIPTLTRVWETEAKLKTAESDYHDTAADVLYVSCINGVPANKKDGDGFIAKVGMDGKIINLKWVTGLSAPKGMGKIGNHLYVADIDKLVVIDISSGNITNTWNVSGAKLLNDVTTSQDSIVYFSDSNTSTIYQMSKGKVSVVFADTTMHGTNGLYLDGTTLYIAGDGATYTLDTRSLKSQKLISGIASGDGIERYGQGFIQTSWDGEVYYIGPDSTTTKILDTKDVKLNTADIEVAENKNLLFIPTFFGNTVTAYTVTMGMGSEQ